MSTARRILVTRTDRLGDVMMTLPSLEYLRAALPDYGIDFLCQPSFHALLEPHMKAKGIRLVDKIEKWNEYEAGLLLFLPDRLLFEAWKGRLPKRFGVRSKWPSLLWLNRGVRQRRSENVRSEAVYNLEVAQALVRELKGAAPELGEFRIRLEGDRPSEIAAQNALRDAGVIGPFLLLHAGTGGTALNLSAEGYARLLSRWPKAVLALSAGPSPIDGKITEELQKLLPHAHRLPKVPLPILRELLRTARLVVGPSTGPIHLAHYVGASTLAVYAPLRGQRPARWAPWGGAGSSRVLTPGHPCPAKRHCLGDRCDRHPCLEVMVREALPTGWADGLMRGS